jgi:DNA-binding transcriptional ArsR family regulator
VNGTEPPTPVFEIWQGAGQIASVDNAVRLRILRELETGPRTLGQLAKATAKGKSTLSSLHLPWLQQAGLVTDTPDPNDARVKWFKLAGSRLGSSAVDAPALRDAVMGFVQSKGLVPLAPLLQVLDVPTMVEKAPAAYCEAVAQRLGVLIGRMVFATAAQERTAELGGILERSGLLIQQDKQSPALIRFLSQVRASALRTTPVGATGPPARAAAKQVAPSAAASRRGSLRS